VIFLNYFLPKLVNLKKREREKERKREREKERKREREKERKREGEKDRREKERKRETFYIRNAFLALFYLNFHCFLAVKS
jgi:hypothetical protein